MGDKWGNSEEDGGIVGNEWGNSGGWIEKEGH